MFVQQVLKFGSAILTWHSLFLVAVYVRATLHIVMLSTTGTNAQSQRELYVGCSRVLKTHVQANYDGLLTRAVIRGIVSSMRTMRYVCSSTLVTHERRYELRYIQLFTSVGE